MSEAIGLHRLGSWLEDLASDAATPGGGPAAALVGAIGAGLISMVARLTVGRERFADVESRMRDIIGIADGERERFLELADLDAEAFEAYMTAFRLPRGTKQEQSARAAAIQNASVAAADVPLEISRRAVDLMELAVEVAAKGNPHAASDGACVRINAASFKDAALTSTYLDQVDELRDRAGRLLTEADQAFAQQLSS